MDLEKKYVAYATSVFSCRKIIESSADLYVDSKACSEEIDVSEWFQVNIAFRHACVMSLLLFNVYMLIMWRER